jgi:hypothetical protein
VKQAIERCRRETQVGPCRTSRPAEETGEESDGADYGIEASVQGSHQAAVQGLVIPKPDQGLSRVATEVLMRYVLGAPQTRVGRYGHKKVGANLHVMD